MNSNETKYFTIYWLNGERKVLSAFPNEEIHECFGRHGYGGGAIKAIDFYQKGIDIDYTYNSVAHTWVERSTMNISFDMCKEMSVEDITSSVENSFSLIVTLENEDQLVIQKKLGNYAQIGYVLHLVVFYAEYDSIDDGYMVTQSENYAIKDMSEAVAAFLERLNSKTPFKCSTRKSDSLDNIAKLEEYKQLL